jgi:hypothetical protein
MNFEQWRGSIKTRLVLLVVACLLAIPFAQAQAGTTQSQSQDIPDAPSTVQPPAPSFPKSSAPVEQSNDQNPNLEPGA